VPEPDPQRSTRNCNVIHGPQSFVSVRLGTEQDGALDRLIQDFDRAGKSIKRGASGRGGEVMEEEFRGLLKGASGGLTGQLSVQRIDYGNGHKASQNARVLLKCRPRASGLNNRNEQRAV